MARTAPRQRPSPVVLTIHQIVRPTPPGFTGWAFGSRTRSAHYYQNVVFQRGVGDTDTVSLSRGTRYIQGPPDNPTRGYGMPVCNGTNRTTYLYPAYAGAYHCQRCETRLRVLAREAERELRNNAREAARLANPRRRRRRRTATVVP